MILIGFGIILIPIGELHYMYSEAKEPVVYEVQKEEVKEQPVQVVVKINWTADRIKQAYREQAEKHNVSFEQMWKTVLCENPPLIPDLQSRWVVNGVREKSYGISQIHLPSWPNVSYEQAIDPQFSAEFMALRFSEGLAHRWTCWRKIYGV